MPSTTGNIAAVETEASSQLKWRLAVRRIAGKPAETTRYSDASRSNGQGRHVEMLDHDRHCDAASG
jgi:hypothetical protein